MTARDPQSPPLARTFERKLDWSRWALMVEEVWPRAWLLLAVATLFVLVSMLGVWPRLGAWPHRVLLGAFALAFLAALIAVLRVRWPAREAAIRRLERGSGVAHRPASSYEDNLSFGADDARTQALWQAHRQRLARLLERLRVAPPAPRTDRRDPMALRVLLLLSAAMALLVVGDSASDRLSAAFRFGGLEAGLNARLDAWVTPPAYTGRPPLLLVDGGYHPSRPVGEGSAVAANDASEGAAGTGAWEVPEKSVLIVRASGGGAISLDVADHKPVEPGAQPPVQHVEGTVPAQPSDVSEVKVPLERDGTITVALAGAKVAQWRFTVIPDLPPKITLTREPERSPRGALKLHFRVEDDYGVVAAEAHVRRLAPKADTSRTAWARVHAKKGPRPPLERPPALALRLPSSYPKKAEGSSFHELGDSPWAGLKVELTLLAKDSAGQTGRSEPVEMLLPERRFFKPLARAVIEQRRRLVEDPRDREEVLHALAALTLAPDEFIDDLQVYLGLRSAYWRLKAEQSRSARNSVIAQLWNVALRIEDGNLTDAERALRAAQERLSKALEEGASDEEIQRLMQELRQALAQFLDQLQRQAQDLQPMQGLNSAQQFLTPNDLEQMLKNLENMARSGNRDAAQQMLSQLRDLLDRLQSGRMADRGQSQRMGQMLDEFGNIVGGEQQLLDQTFSERRRQGEQQGEQGQGSEGNAQGLGDRQRELRERLGRLQRGLRQFGMNAPGQLGAAEDAMERAERELRGGNLAGAEEEEGRALDALRQGAREMAQQMLRQMPSRYGMGEPPGELDPMGRPPQRTDGPDPGVGVKVPDEIDVQRAREILEELRRRLGESTRPPVELDYLERLLQRF